MADLTGPGAVVRMWSANPMGTLRMYFDGELKPRIKVPMRTWIEQLQKQNPNLKDCAFWAGPGWNVYVPFLYKKSLKITMEPGAKESPGGLYYHVGYRTFRPGTFLGTFEPSMLNEKYEMPDPVVPTISDSLCPCTCTDAVGFGRESFAKVLSRRTRPYIFAVRVGGTEPCATVRSGGQSGTNDGSPSHLCRCANPA